MVSKWKRRIIFFILFLLVLETSFWYLDIKNRGDSEGAVIAGMAWGLILVWIFCGGYFMYRVRGRIRAKVLLMRGTWETKFVIFATLLALLEEIVTVVMTNLAPVFGGTYGTIGITASTNYIDVVLFHSVVVFVPLFIAIAKLLKKYSFSPFAVFIIFGILGTAVEAFYQGNLANFILLPMWMFVYGLMVYLPAYSIPANRGAVAPRVWHYLYAPLYILAIALPMIVALVLLIVGVLDHPDRHF